MPVDFAAWPLYGAAVSAVILAPSIVCADQYERRNSDSFGEPSSEAARNKFMMIAAAQVMAQAMTADPPPIREHETQTQDAGGETVARSSPLPGESAGPSSPARSTVASSSPSQPLPLTPPPPVQTGSPRVRSRPSSPIATNFKRMFSSPRRQQQQPQTLAELEC